MTDITFYGNEKSVITSFSKYFPELESLCTMVRHGEQILTIAVMAILITAPLGAAAIMLTGPRLLHNDNDTDNDNEDTEKETVKTP